MYDTILDTSIQVGLYRFEGPTELFAAHTRYLGVAGVYLIVAVVPDGTEIPLDVGQSHDIGDRLAQHGSQDGRQRCWFERSGLLPFPVEINVRVHHEAFVPSRLVVESFARASFELQGYNLCGKR